jgi:hypothetical protein
MPRRAGVRSLPSIHDTWTYGLAGLALLLTGIAAVTLTTGIPTLSEKQPETLSPAAHDTTLTPTSGRPFSPDSAFNTRIEGDPEIDPRTDEMVALLAGRGFATAGVYENVPPVYHANSQTPRYTMECTEDAWGTCDVERMQVPIPDGAEASHGSDASMVVIDWSTRQVFEFWKYRNDRRTTAWSAVLPLDGSGTGSGDSDPGRYGAVGAGTSRLAGLVRTFEVRQGRIDHALVGATGFACQGRHRYPAVKSDGWVEGDEPCIPQGARVQLDPSVDCEGLAGARPWEVMVCRALQDYGWYNIDNGNPGVRGFTIQFENPILEPDPYPAVGLHEHTATRAIPLDRLRVLAAHDSFD